MSEDDTCNAEISSISKRGIFDFHIGEKVCLYLDYTSEHDLIIREGVVMDPHSKKLNGLALKLKVDRVGRLTPSGVRTLFSIDKSYVRSFYYYCIESFERVT